MSWAFVYKLQSSFVASSAKKLVPVRCMMSAQSGSHCVSCQSENQRSSTGKSPFISTRWSGQANRGFFKASGLFAVRFDAVHHH